MLFSQNYWKMPKNQINLRFIKPFKLTAIFVFLFTTILSAQVVIDGIAGIVGNNIVLNSDIEQQLLQYQAQGLEIDSALRVQVLEDLLFQKLMLHQALLDSVVVTENEVLNEVDSRIDNFIAQLGGEDQLESYFDKKIYEKVVSELTSAVKTIGFGNDDDSKNDIPPLITAEHRDRVSNFIEKAKSSGSKLQSVTKEI